MDNVGIVYLWVPISNNFDKMYIGSHKVNIVSDKEFISDRYLAGGISINEEVINEIGRDEFRKNFHRFILFIGVNYTKHEGYYLTQYAEKNPSNFYNRTYNVQNNQYDIKITEDAAEIILLDGDTMTSGHQDVTIRFLNKLLNLTTDNKSVTKIKRIVKSDEKKFNGMITPRQQDLLTYIDKQISINGYSPTYDEMRLELGLQSKSGISRMIVALAKRNYIKYIPGNARAIEIIKK